MWRLFGGTCILRHTKKLGHLLSNLWIRLCIIIIVLNSKIFGNHNFEKNAKMGFQKSII